MPVLIPAEETTYNEIKERILDGRFEPGKRLVLRTLAKELGFSTIPVVVALRMLERDGLVVNTPGMGACVRAWSKKEIIHLYKIRAFIESLAARLCAEECGAGDVEQIVAADELVVRSIDESDPAENIQGEIAFHTAVVRGAHCADLERIAEGVSVMRSSMLIYSVKSSVPGTIPISLKLAPDYKWLHEPIIKAIMAHDADAAERAAREHVEQSLERYLAWVDQPSAVAAKP